MATRHVLIPEEAWTPVSANVFSDVLPSLKERLSSVLYLILYHRYHHGVKPVRASKAQLCRWSNMNERTLQKCLSELERQGFIVRVKKGKRHSKTNKPAWRVPLARIDLSVADSWTAVPRFLITKYCRRCHNAVLLVVILKYQHQWYKNDCWPGTKKLAEITGWSPARINRAIRTMGHRLEWKQAGAGLPWPLKLTFAPRPGKKPWRHFQVRAVVYNKRNRTVRLSREFEKYFKLKA